MEAKEFPILLEAQGSALANESVDLTLTVQEKVKSINFEDGMRVHKGDLILELENDTEKVELEQALINRDEAKREYERIAGLYRSHIASQKDYDVQKTAYDRSVLLVDIAQNALNDRILKAPFDGILGIRRVSPGDLVTPGSLITTLDDITRIKVDFTVPEKYFAQMAPGMTFTGYNSAYPDHPFEGVVTTVSVRLNDVTRSVQIRGEIENPDNGRGGYLLRPGMLLSLSVKLAPQTVVVIPEKAVQSLGEIQYIFILREDGSVERREIETGIRRDGFVQIVKGASAGERYIDEGVTN